MKKLKIKVGRKIETGCDSRNYFVGRSNKGRE
jgi:hypothetical protein